MSKYCTSYLNHLRLWTFPRLHISQNKFNQRTSSSCLFEVPKYIIKAPFWSKKCRCFIGFLKVFRVDHSNLDAIKNYRRVRTLKVVRGLNPSIISLPLVFFLFLSKPSKKPKNRIFGCFFLQKNAILSFNVN